MFTINDVHDDWKDHFSILSHKLSAVDSYYKLNYYYNYINDILNFLKMPLNTVRAVILKEENFLPGGNRNQYYQTHSGETVVYEFNSYMYNMINSDNISISPSKQYDLSTLQEKGVLLLQIVILEKKDRELEILFNDFIMEIIRTISKKGDVVWINTCMNMGSLCPKQSIVRVQNYTEDESLHVMPVIPNGNYIIDTKFMYHNSDTTNYFKITNQVLNLINKLPIKW